MPFGLDTSAVTAWFFPDEDATVAARTERRLVDDAAPVPTPLWFEVRNLLPAGERRGRVGAPDTARSRPGTPATSSLPGTAPPGTAPPVTLDRRLAAAAAAEGVGVTGSTP